MGQKVTIGMTGTLQLSLDGAPTPSPLEVGIEGLELDLDVLMEQGKIKLSSDPKKVNVRLDGVTLTLTLDAREVMSRATKSIVDGLETML